MSKTITVPEAGRSVHYVPLTDGEDGHCVYAGEAYAATIAFVHRPAKGDTWPLVNLSVLDANGEQFNRVGVRLQQPGGPVPAGVSYARWMPYHLERKAELDGAATSPHQPAA